jgi:hypothetical protein
MRTLTRLAVIVALAASGGGTLTAQTTTSGPVMEVYKTATCGCCGKWVEHMKAAGFTTRVTDLEDADLQKLKGRHGVPDSAKSCHTARVGGYTIEGHVPASEVKRLLVEGRKVVGLAVPGMPLGSPGMEVQGVKPHPYDVLTFDASGNTKVFSTIKP